MVDTDLTAQQFLRGLRSDQGLGQSGETGFWSLRIRNCILKMGVPHDASDRHVLLRRVPVIVDGAWIFATAEESRV